MSLIKREELLLWMRGLAVDEGIVALEECDADDPLLFVVHGSRADE